jgi:hypothetical protein
MSLTAEQIAEREWEMMCDPDKVRVSVSVQWMGGLCLPDPDGEEEVEAVFKAWTFGDNWVVDKACRYDTDRGDGKKTPQTDLNEFRRMMLKRGLLSWTLDIPIERQGGWLTPGCYARVGSVYAPLIEAIVGGYEETMSLSKKEEGLLQRQSAVLFSPTSRGVADACEAVSIFCTWGNFAEKFGLDKDKLRDLPYKEYVMLKMMMGKEGEAIRRHQGAKKDRHAGTRIATGGGKVRASRGKKIAL